MSCKPVLIAACLFLPFAAAAQAPYELVWSDEFNSGAIDTSNWTHEVNAWGGGNNELQYYTSRPQNSYVADGNLVIRAIKETYTGPEGTRQYTSARLNSRFKADFLYGRFEARVKIPNGQGLWPAVWMLPSDWEYGGWAASGEIDILEVRGETPWELIGSIHYGGEWPMNNYSSTSHFGPDFSQNFHVYAIEWEEGEIRWYIDGQRFATKTNWYSTDGPYPAPFDKRFHLLMNVAVGGNFLQNPPPNADYFPKEMQVDWVRVYQRPERSFFLGAPIDIPGRVEAEDFDAGTQGIVFVDNTQENLGGVYRPDQPVDLEATTDAGGGFNIGWVEPGEFVEYSLEASSAGPVRIRARVASNNNGGTFNVRLRQGSDEFVVGPFNAPHTNGWQTWTTLESDAFQLPAGPMVARLEILSGEFNINWIEFESATVPGSAFIMR